MSRPRTTVHTWALVATLLAALVTPLVGAAPVAEAQQACSPQRAAGSGRVETAAAISRTVRNRADHVVLAVASGYPDALAAVPLAHSRDAPLLLTSGASLSDAARQEIRRLEATRVTILGGTTAISARVARQLRGMDLAVDRLSGGNRYETAVTVAGAMPDANHVVVVEGANGDPGRGWPDAVVAGPFAAQAGAPILMVSSTSVPKATAAALASINPDRITIIGGTASVNDDVLQALAGRHADGTWQRRVERISGTDRYTTSTEVAWEQRRHSTPPKTVWLATGREYPDALAAGAAAAKTGGSVLLVDGQRALADEPASTFRRDLAAQVDRVVVVGGTAAVSGAVMNAARDIMCDRRVPTPDLGQDALACVPGGSANHRRVTPGPALKSASEAYQADSTPENALAVMRAAGPFTSQFDTQSHIRADFVDWVQRTGLGTAYHETLHAWQHAGAPPYRGTLQSCLVLDEQQRGMIATSLPDSATDPQVIAEPLRTRAKTMLGEGTFQYDAVSRFIDTYLACPDGTQVCASAHEHVSSLMGEFHAYVTGYELDWALVRAGAIPDPSTTPGRTSMDGGYAVIPGTAMYLRHLRTNDPTAWQQFVDLNGPALAELWRIFERNYPGPFAQDDGRVWDYVFKGGMAHEIALATSGRAGFHTPRRP